MDIIKSIDIRYFRSIYRVRLKDLRAFNVLSGRNDAGKSNILKALNLFFNGDTDWRQSLQFYRDFSLSRLSQVRKESVKGKQFISIEIEFNRPDSYKGSLPKVFKVKRTWHRDGRFYSETNNLVAPASIEHLPSSLNTAKRFLPIFLNRVRFEYIPAIKERMFFNILLSRLQHTLLGNPIGEDSAISQVVNNLATHIQDQIVRLSEDFERATHIKTSIEPPNEFAALFRSFLVSTSSGDENIPLILRGDGIQARFISSVLQYISDSSNDFVIWGFEEPENSLEYSHIVNLAKDFAEIYSKKAQIFVTTHSPAFTSIREEENTCFRVYQQNGLSEVKQIWPEHKGSFDREELNIEMGFMQIQENLHIEYIKQSEQLRNQQNRIVSLEGEIQNEKKPLVLTEGKTDQQILEIAWTKLRPGIDYPFLIRAADPASGILSGGAGGADSLSKMIESVHPADGRLVIAVFDRDEQGSKCFDKLSKNFKFWKNRSDIKVHINCVAYAILLPIPPSRVNYAKCNNLCIEYLFPDSALHRRNPEGLGLIIKEPLLNGIVVNNKRIAVVPEQISFNFSLDGHQTISDGKIIFANEIVPILDQMDFADFNPLLLLLDEIIG